MVKRLINLVNHIDFKDDSGRSIKEYAAWDEILAPPQNNIVIEPIKLSADAPLSEVVAALTKVARSIIPKPKPKGPELHDVGPESVTPLKGLYTNDHEPMTRAEHEEHRKQGRMTGKLYTDSLSGQEYLQNRDAECKSSEPGECIDLEADSRFRKSWEESKALSAEKLIADGREYTLYTDGGPYLKMIEVNDPETFELTYDRVLDEVLSNPSATGLKVEVTKDKFVATLEYKL